MQEKRPAPTAESTPTVEEDVVAKVHLNHDKIVNGEIPFSEKLLVEIRDDLSKLECYPMYREYTNGMVPTLSILQNSVERTLMTIDALLNEERAKGLSDTDLATEIKIRNLIAGRTKSIKRNISSYINTVIRFHNLKRLSAGGARDIQEQFVKTDEARRRAHDALLDSLRVMTMNTRKASDEDLLQKNNVVEWFAGMSARDLSNNEKTIIVFSEKTLSDRDFIKDWAIAADFDQQLQEILATQKK